MRARNLKPGFFKNEELSNLPFEARLLFQGLWCLADREGRFEWRPKRIRAEIFPYDNVDIEDLLCKLRSCNVITCYDIDGTEYGLVVNFKQHQNPHNHEAASKIPAPKCEEKKPSINQCHDIDDTLRGEARECRADSLFSDSLIPDSLTPSTLIPDSSGQVRVPGYLGPLFEKFWEAYPKQRKRGLAERSFCAIFPRPDDELVARMIEAIESAKKSEDWTKENGRYIPAPHNWLDAKSWLDDLNEPLCAKSASQVWLEQHAQSNPSEQDEVFYAQ